MANANGTQLQNPIRNTKDIITPSGKKSPFYTYPYIEYTPSSSNTKGKIDKTLVLYEREAYAGEIIPIDAKRGGTIFKPTIFVVGAYLENGKLLPAKRNNTEYLTISDNLLPIPPALGSDPKAFVLGADARKALTETGPDSLLERTIKSTSILASRKITGLTEAQARAQLSPRTAPSKPPNPTTTTSSANSTDTSQSGNGGSINNSQTATVAGEELFLTEISESNIPYLLKQVNFGDLSYPNGIGKNGQDCIKFEIIQYQGRTYDSNKIQLSDRFATLNKESSRGSILLGIQPRISDNNSVDWSLDKMGAVEMIAQNTLAQLAMDNADEGIKTIENALGVLSDKGLASSVLAKIAATAIGSQNNLFTRITGAIVNPNVELLFQGPSLRDFPFTFSLIPRDEDEATKVKKIIRAFKQASAVQLSTSQLFLKSPSVFKITYLTPSPTGTNLITHPSLNRIKICALKSVSVDYTPAGTYMTYGDDTHTMTAYTVQLSFTELEPIYDKDYENLDLGAIGY